MINENTGAKQTESMVDFNHAVELVKLEIDGALLNTPKIIRDYMSYMTLARGKLIRATSLLVCAENKKGLISISAIKLAAAIEILHLATLVHDDVIDNAKMRRGHSTLQNKFGQKKAVICGDYLFCVSLQLAGSVTNKQEYLDLDVPNYMSKICLGELRQNLNHRNVELSVLHYLKIISGKTAALFEACFFAGAALCEDAKDETKLYSRLGHFIGMIFQLTDDCIDFEAPKELAKKPVQSDFEQGVITLPLIYAFQNMSIFKEKAKNDDINREEINKAVFKTGGINYTRLISKKYYNKALKIIEQLDVEELKKERLLKILDKAYRGLKPKT